MKFGKKDMVSLIYYICYEFIGKSQRYHFKKNQSVLDKVNYRIVWLMCKYRGRSILV